MEAKRIYIPLLGELEVEIDLVVFQEEPLLFVGIKQTGERYLALNLDLDKLDYVLVKVTPGRLIAMLEGAETMRGMYENVPQSVVYRVTEKEDGVQTKEMKVQDLCDECLPDRGANYEVCTQEIEDYKNMLKKERAGYV